MFVRIARPLPPRYRCFPSVPKQETKTEETKAESFPIKVEVSVPEEKEEEVKTEETVAEPVKEAEVVAEPEVVAPVEEEKKKELSPFEAKLKQLEEMGFVNRERNIETLVKRSGDLVKTIRDLLE